MSHVGNLALSSSMKLQHVALVPTSPLLDQNLEAVVYAGVGKMPNSNDLNAKQACAEKSIGNSLTVCEHS